MFSQTWWALLRPSTLDTRQSPWWHTRGFHAKLYMDNSTFSFWFCSELCISNSVSVLWPSANFCTADWLSWLTLVPLTGGFGFEPCSDQHLRPKNLFSLGMESQSLIRNTERYDLVKIKAKQLEVAQITNVTYDLVAYYLLKTRLLESYVLRWGSENQQCDWWVNCTSCDSDGEVFTWS